MYDTSVESTVDDVKKGSELAEYTLGSYVDQRPHTPTRLLRDEELELIPRQQRRKKKVLGCLNSLSIDIDVLEDRVARK